MHGRPIHKCYCLHDYLPTRAFDHVFKCQQWAIKVAFNIQLYMVEIFCCSLGFICVENFQHYTVVV